MRINTAVTTIAIFSLAVFISSCQTQKDIALPQALWNGNNIDNWLFVGKNPDEKLDWKVDDGVLNLPGGTKGYIRTKNAFKNYSLLVEWKYTGKPKNGGVLAHLNGDDRVWPTSVQAQFKKGYIGDLIAMEGFYVSEAEGKPKGIVPHGELKEANYDSDWVAVKVICLNNRIDVFVNDVLVNTGTALERDSGFIGIQLEGVPIAYRKIELMSLDR